MDSTQYLSPAQQNRTIATLVSIRFLSMMDFIVIIPLAPQLMQHFSISPLQFGILVSVYSVGAALGGIAGAFFIDRFDRKRALLTLLLGFGVATLICGVAPSYLVLLAARTLAGMCGGNMETLGLTIIGDGFPEDRRASATGKVMAGMALALIFGVPGGLTLAASFNWHTPFLLVGALATLLWAMGLFSLPSMTGHLLIQQRENAWQGFRELLRFSVHRRALGCTAILTFAAMSILPYTATYYVLNLGVTNDQLPIIYLVGGSFAVISAPLLGWLADRYGKRRVFTILALAAIVPMLVITHLRPVPLGVIVLFATMMMVTRSGYYSAAEALIASMAHPSYRGRFMSIDGTCEQISISVTMFLTGMIVGTDSEGRLTGFGLVGVLGAAMTLVAIVLFRRLPSLKQEVATGSQGSSALQPHEVRL